MICSRYRENKQFVPRKYFQIKVSAAKDGIAFSALSRNRFDDLETATAGLREVEDGGMLAVSSVERREAVQEPPLLYDLTALQKEANGKLDFSADKTLTLAQSLYEKKVLSYPRTGSRYISEDVFEEIPSRITLLQQYPRFAAIASALRDTPLNRRPVDDAKSPTTMRCSLPRTCPKVCRRTSGLSTKWLPHACSKPSPRIASRK